ARRDSLGEPGLSPADRRRPRSRGPKRARPAHDPGARRIHSGRAPVTATASPQFAYRDKKLGDQGAVTVATSPEVFYPTSTTVLLLRAARRALGARALRPDRGRRRRRGGVPRPGLRVVSRRRAERGGPGRDAVDPGSAGRGPGPPRAGRQAVVPRADAVAGGARARAGARALR